MSSASQDTRQRVYVALKHVFSGKHAQLRDRNAIHRRVIVHEWGNVQSLVNEYSRETVVKVAKALLRERVFQSESKARSLFPDAFAEVPVSTEGETQPQPHATSEPDEVDAALARQLREGAESPAITDEESFQKADEPTSPLTQPAAASPPSPLKNPLSPTFLPFETQHAIMTAVQSSLEHIFFSYGRRFLPELLQSRHWTCAVEMELNTWADEFRQLPEHFLKLNNISPEALDRLFKSMSYIRLVAVRRIEISAKKICECIGWARDVAEILQSPAAAAAFQRLRGRVCTEFDRLETEQARSLDDLERVLDEVAAGRRALDQQEMDARAAADKRESGHTRAAKKGVLDALDEFHVITSIVPTEQIPSDGTYPESQDAHVVAYDSDVVFVEQG